MLFSIVTINYNNREGLERTIESVLSQTNRDFEYIVVDGGSTDGSVEVIRKYASGISRWVSERDGGIYNAMNKGLQMAQGDYINFLNSGDCFVDASALNLVDALLSEWRDVGFVYSDHFDSVSGNPLVYHPARPFWEQKTRFTHKGFCHQTAFVRRDLALRFPFDEGLKVAADYKMFYEIYSEGYNFAKVPTPVVAFDITGTSQQNHRLAFREDAMVRGVYPGVSYLYHYFLKFYYCPLKSRFWDFVRRK